MLKIIIKNLRLYGFHGVHEHEKENGQYFIFNIGILLSDDRIETDNIKETVNYSEAIKLLKKINKENKYDLIETLSKTIARGLLETFKKAESVIVKVEKESPPIKEDIQSVGVEYSTSRLYHSENIAYLSLGSNIGDKKDNILKAISFIGQDKHIRILKSSSLYETEPMYLKDQPSFYNTVLKVAVMEGISPFMLLGILKNIEYLLGRDENVEKNGPRVIDIDILFYADHEVHTKILTIPHPKIAERNFVLKPLEEIEPGMIIENTDLKDLLGKKTFHEKVKKILDIGSMVYLK